MFSILSATHRNFKKLALQRSRQLYKSYVLRTLVENELATKQDIADVQRDIAELRKETQQGIENLRKETQLGQAQIVADLKKEIAESKAETLKWITGML